MGDLCRDWCFVDGAAGSGCGPAGASGDRAKGEGGFVGLAIACVVFSRSSAARAALDFEGAEDVVASTWWP